MFLGSKSSNKISTNPLETTLTHILTHNRLSRSVKCTPKSGHEKLTQYPDLWTKNLTHSSKVGKDTHLCYIRLNRWRCCTEHKEIVYTRGSRDSQKESLHMEGIAGQNHLYAGISTGILGAEFARPFRDGCI